jgi:hypothetical protein
VVAGNRAGVVVLVGTYGRGTELVVTREGEAHELFTIRVRRSARGQPPRFEA